MEDSTLLRRRKTKLGGPQGLSKAKAHGIHYTPKALAKFVATRIIRAFSFEGLDTVVALDPACGEGELLWALYESVPEELVNRVNLVGIDSDESSLQSTRARFRNFHTVLVSRADFLKVNAEQHWPPQLFANGDSNPLLPLYAHIIIANPPYVRTQNIGATESRRLAEAFGLTGRVDLYQAFVVAMTQTLLPNGVLGVILPNRFLFTESGESLREFLNKEFEILELFDLGDTKLFEAAVLPSVFVGKKRNQYTSIRDISQNTQFAKVYEKHIADRGIVTHIRSAKSVIEILSSDYVGNFRVDHKIYEISRGRVNYPAGNLPPWRLVTSGEAAFLKAIESRARSKLSDLANVKVGIKTTADKVFIRDDWDRLPEGIRPEGELLKPVLSSDDAVRWAIPKIRKTETRVLYTHEVRDGKRSVIDLKKFPRGKAYLEKNRRILENREYIRESNRNWFEIWVPQNPVLWEKPKIVFPDITPQPIFYLDTDGCIVNGDCYWIYLKAGISPDILFLILGLANSRIITLYHDLAFSNKLYSGRRRYLTQYVGNYPVPDPNLDSSKAVIALGKELTLSCLTETEIKELEGQVEQWVAKSFGVESSLPATE